MSTEKETKEVKQDAAIGMSREDLLALIAAVKAPNVVEQAELDRKAREREQERAARERLAKSVLEDLNAKRMTQSLCSHEGADGHSHAVFIQEKIGPGYFICQKHQCKIRPEPKPTDHTVDHNATYSTAQYNRLFQKQMTADVIG